jgi:hypothetical protein
MVDVVVAAASGAALEIAELRNQDGGDREAAPSENGARGRFSLLGRNAACVVRSSARASYRRHRSPETDSEAFSSACRHIWSASLTGAVVFGFQVTKIELWGTSASRAHRAEVIG